jgi:AraC-like DNA-binding protein
MPFVFDGRTSDSPFVETIWRTQSEGISGSFMSVAAAHWEMVVTRQYGRVTLSIRGPETKASPAPIPTDAEFLGIIFKLGTFMPQLPANKLVDGGIHLPEAAGQSFWLHGSAWQFPNFDNADTFVARLIRQGLLAYEPIVPAALQGQLTDLSVRSVQRRFLRATGLTHGTISQIQRARYALELLQQGVSIGDTVDLVGYADQPHLTRSLKRFAGQTPAQLIVVSKSK